MAFPALAALGRVALRGIGRSAGRSRLRGRSRKPLRSRINTKQSRKRKPLFSLKPSRKRLRKIDNRRGVRQTKSSEAYAEHRFALTNNSLVKGTENMSTPPVTDNLYLSTPQSTFPTCVRQFESSQGQVFISSLSHHILKTATGFNIDQEDCKVDIESIAFQLDIKNHSPSRDILCRFIMFRDVEDMDGDWSTTVPPDPGLNDFFMDELDECKRYSFDSDFSNDPKRPFRNTLDKLNAKVDSRKYKVYLDKTWKIGFNANAQGSQEVRDIRTNQMDSNVNGQLMPTDFIDNVNPTLSNNPNYVMGVTRQITTMAGHNERRENITWKPKDGFRLGYHISSHGGQMQETFLKPDANLYCLWYCCEKSLFPSEEATPAPFTYNFKYKVHYNDVL